ncbi:8-oxo-dGTP diphosphatase [Halobacillus karajensis]|uniref:NADH pyrophosphatase n=1 Tax=Halobacillus karajensis TaxID=195088 RepID=A0A024P8Q7_9BACI|nr:NUDIX hydrolase [Halobacillus karajensis]CDQ19346.1 NADH pyrophosphatase [Halobacillus karajensis]CDQ25305.1 NADH pyrophosphatase [Halobacillus karajensis]CDQ25972.1 NADH pyrophosphatase [Halobacillus karajensis]SEH38070.1 8-oxo-dGTP diphosphatase [Halobacillus karajensis]
MDRVDVAYAFIFNEIEERVLMVKNKGSGWSLPGGAVEEGETFEQAAIRESKEETNLTIETENIVAVNEAFFENKGHHALFITYKAKIVEGAIQIIHKDEIDDIKWMDINTANQLMPYHAGGVESLLESSAPYTFQG